MLQLMQQQSRPPLESELIFGLTSPAALSVSPVLSPTLSHITQRVSRTMTHFTALNLNPEHSFTKYLTFQPSFNFKSKQRLLMFPAVRGKRGRWEELQELLIWLCSLRGRINDLVSNSMSYAKSAAQGNTGNNKCTALESKQHSKMDHINQESEYVYKDFFN